MSLTLGTDRARLSKRHGATSVMAYRDMGYLPQALNNFIVRLGWSSGDQEIFSTEELIQKFSLEHVGKSAGVFNVEKLNWLNAHYIKEESDEHLAQLVIPFLHKKGYTLDGSLDLVKVVKGFKERSKTLDEMADKASFYFKDTLEYDPDAAAKFLTARCSMYLPRCYNMLKAAGRQMRRSWRRCSSECRRSADSRSSSSPRATVSP